MSTFFPFFLLSLTALMATHLILFVQRGLCKEGLCKEQSLLIKLLVSVCVFFLLRYKRSA